MPESLIDAASDPLSELWEAEWQETILDAAIANVKRRVDPQNYQIFDFYVNKQWPAAKVASTFNVNVDQVYLSKRYIGKFKSQAEAEAAYKVAAARHLEEAGVR